MAKGWSFNGLVQALKSAAFKDTGKSVGQIPVVGDSGLLLTDSLEYDNTLNLNTKEYRNNETFTLKEFSNFPGNTGTHFIKGVDYSVTVLAVKGKKVTLLLVAQDVVRNPVILKRSAAGVWYADVSPGFREIDTPNLNINDLNQRHHMGTWFQPMNNWTSPELGYPVGRAGVLEVIPCQYSVMQRYTVYDTGRVYIRIMPTEGSGSFGLWKEVLTAASVQYFETRTTVPFTSNPTEWSTHHIKYPNPLREGEQAFVTVFFLDGAGAGAISFTVENQTQFGFTLRANIYNPGQTTVLYRSQLIAVRVETKLQGTTWK